MQQHDSSTHHDAIVVAAGSVAESTPPNFPPSAGESHSETQAMSLAPSCGHVQPVTILLVEDEETLRTAVVKMLRKKGFEVLEAADGTAAVNLLRVLGDRLTLLLLDVTLPGLPSRNVLEEARRIRPGISVILTSAFTQNVAKSSFDGLHVDHFIRKPYRLALLLELLETVLPTL